MSWRRVVLDLIWLGIMVAIAGAAYLVYTGRSPRAFAARFVPALAQARPVPATAARRDPRAGPAVRPDSAIRADSARSQAARLATWTPPEPGCAAPSDSIHFRPVDGILTLRRPICIPWGGQIILTASGQITAPSTPRYPQLQFDAYGRWMDSLDYPNGCEDVFYKKGLYGELLAMSGGRWEVVGSRSHIANASRWYRKQAVRKVTALRFNIDPKCGARHKGELVVTWTPA
jgi:hypothetical protein